MVFHKNIVCELFHKNEIKKKLNSYIHLEFIF